MSVGTYISGTGHAVLIVWMIVGWGMSSDPLPFEVTEVSVVSGEDFAAMTQGVQPELPPSESATIEQPTVEETPPTPDVQTPPDVPESPAPVEQPAVETPPEAPDLSVPDTIVTDTPPDMPDTPQMITPPPSAEIGESSSPIPRPSPRVAPEIIAPPSPDASVAPEVAEAATELAEEPVEEVTEPAEETTAPEAAATEIVTEAEEPVFAPEISSRPQTRPNRPAAVAQAPTDTPTETSAQAPTETPADPTIDPVAAALAAAGATDTPATPSPSSTPTPGISGGQLSEGDKTGFLRQVGNCWNTGTLSTGAQNTIIEMAFDMTPDGRPVTGSVRMDGYSGGNSTDADAAFQAARRALLRCAGDTGYDLPSDQYNQWQRVILTVDPTAMRQR